MSNEAPTALILGGTGRTGSLLAGKLARRGVATRTAARRGADVRHHRLGERRPVSYNDIDQEAWISGALAAGVPADYAVMLRWLTGAIIAGGGSVPADDIEKVTGRRPPSAASPSATSTPGPWRRNEQDRQ